MKSRTYDKDYLNKYLAFVPQKYRDAYEQPDDFYWQWKNNNIHIDFKSSLANRTDVILIHGAGANGRILSMFGSYLHKNGVNYYAPDNLGYGLTELSTTNFKYDDWVLMLCDFIQYIKEKNNNEIVLIGLSVGGMTAYHIASKIDGIKGIVATTLVDPRDKETLMSIAKNRFIANTGLKVMKNFSALTDQIKLPIKYLCKMNLMSRNLKFSKVFENDNLGGGARIPLKFLRTFTEYNPVIKFEDFDKCPILLLHPEKDEWTPINLSLKNFDKIKSRKTLKILKECGHAPIESPGIYDIEYETIKFIKENTGV